MKKTAFTLVELIVVITILVILGTIAFINFKGATLSARDSVRISDVTNITNALYFYNTKSGSFPIPENSISVTYSGDEISKIGNLSKSALGALGLSGNLVDPQTKESYPYTLTNNKKIMLVANLEGNSSNLNTVVIASGDDVFAKGNAKSTYLTTDYKVPTSNIELTSTSDTKTYVSVNSFSEVSKGQLTAIKGNAFTSCNDVHQLLPGKSKGQFDIMINGEPKSVNCDSGWMKYVDIKGNYTSQNALDCFDGEWIDNSNIYCLNPWRSGISGTKIKTVIGEKYSSVEIGDKFEYKITPSITPTETKSARYCYGHEKYFTVMVSPADKGVYNHSTIKRMRFGKSSCVDDTYEVGGISLTTPKYMNFSSNSKYGPINGGRDTGIKKMSLWIK